VVERRSGQGLRGRQEQVRAARQGELDAVKLESTRNIDIEERCRCSTIDRILDDSLLALAGKTGIEASRDPGRHG
jgi:hypothetical protein